MANKWDLNTAVTSLTSTVSGMSIGTVVAQGKKRFVTYIKVQCRGIANTVFVGETVASVNTTITAAATKFTQYVNTEYEYPEAPGDVDHPLFAIDSAFYLCAVTSDDDADNTILTMQYYDA